MFKNKIIIFTNNNRSIEIIRKLKKKFQIELIVTLKKECTKNLFNKIKKFKIPLLFLNTDYEKLYNKIRLISPNFIICAGFTKIIPKKILDLASVSAINLHGGRVPNYLGASTLNWQIINNEKFVYISALKMNSIIDGGPLIAEKKIKLKNNDYIDNVQKKLNSAFPKLCLVAINKQLRKFKMINYPISQRIYWRQRNKNDSEINIMNSSYLEIYNNIRACSYKNYPAFLKIKNKKYFLNKVKIINHRSRLSDKKVIITKKNVIINFKNKHLLIEILKK